MSLLHGPFAALALATAACPLLMLLVLRARGAAGVSPVEVGVLFSAIVAVYALFPLLGFILSGNSWELNVDVRLAYLSTATEDVAQVAGLYLAFLGGFCLSYSLLRSRGDGFRPSDVVVADWRTPMLLTILATTIVLLPHGLRWMFGVQAAEDYLGTYVELVGQPLWVQQIFGLVFSIGNVLIVAAIVAALAFDRRALPLVGAAVGTWVGLSIFGGGSRLVAMAALLSLIVGYSYLVKPISLRLAAVLGMVLIVTFLAAQYLRDFAATEAIGGLESLLINGEFASIYINGLEMAQQRDLLASQSLLPNFYTVDLVRLVPQQFLPFEKVDPSRWYVTTFYPGYAEVGGGLAFGAIAESAAGMGTIEALARGVLLGAAFAAVHNLLVERGRHSLLCLVAYVWLVVFCYNSFRDTTFVMGSRFLFHAVPALVTVYLVQRVLSAARTRPYVPAGETNAVAP